MAEIHINDVDRSIWAFWHCALNETDAFMGKIKSTKITVDEWFRQRDIYRNPASADVLHLAFAAFFLNRTNRSGIIKGGGVIGGIDQKGAYKIDCRFNHSDLVRRIARMGKYRDRIHLTNLDALDFMEGLDRSLPRRSLWFVRPPLFSKGG